MSGFGPVAKVVVRPIADLYAVADTASQRGVTLMDDLERKRWGSPWRKGAFYAALAALLLVAIISLARAIF